MNLRELSKQRGVYTDADDIEKFGHLAAWIDDQGRVKVSLGSRAAGKAFLHRLILATDKCVDHINMNPSDNRKHNLRPATRAQNKGNLKKYSNNTSGYKGVVKNRKRWVAQIQVGGVNKYLGIFDTREQAAIAYNEAAVKFFGEFAKLNEVINEAI